MYLKYCLKSRDLYRFIILYPIWAGPTRVLLILRISKDTNYMKVKLRFKVKGYSLFNLAFFITFNIAHLHPNSMLLRIYFFLAGQFLMYFKKEKITFIKNKIIILPRPFDTWCIKWYWIKTIGQNLEFKRHQWEIIPYVIRDESIVQSYFDGRTMTL